MNLVDDPWLPIVDKKGIFRKVGLLELFQNGRQFTDFVLPVSERIALMRFLICLTYASISIPKDRLDWREIAPDYEKKVISYLEENKNLFNLLDPVNPFMQFPDIEPSGKDGMGKTDKLNMNLASGSTESLFDNDAEHRNSMPLDELARSLITIQCFSLNGLTSQVNWNGKDSSKSAKRSLLFGVAHAFLIGQSILESIHLNLLTELDIAQIPFGTPAWENKPKNFGEIANHQQTFLGSLVPFRRLICLSPGGERMANGAVAEELFSPDPYLAIETVTKARPGKEIGNHFAKISETKDLWRQFGGLLFYKLENQLPKHLTRFSQIEQLMNHQEDKSFEIWVGVIHAAPGVNSKIISVVESRYHFSKYWTNETEGQARNLYEEWLSQNVKLAVSLKISIKKFLTELNAKFSSEYLSEKQKIAEEIFWNRITEFVPSFFLLKSEEEVMAWIQEWPNRGNTICSEIKNNLIQPDSPRSYRAWALVQRKK